MLCCSVGACGRWWLAARARTAHAGWGVWLTDRVRSAPQAAYEDSAPNGLMAGASSEVKTLPDAEVERQRIDRRRATVTPLATACSTGRAHMRHQGDPKPPPGPHGMRASRHGSRADRERC